MKRITKVLSCLMAAAVLLTACAGNNNTPVASSEAPQNASSTQAPAAKYKIKLAAQATSGQVFQFMAEEKKFLEEEGIEVELIYINNGTDAFSALSSGQVDVISTYGTGGPLIQIANGQDFTSFGGYMIIGATPVFALPETKYESVEDFRGKKIAIMRGGTPDIVLKGILYDAGFDVAKDVTFIELKKNTDVMQAVKNGEADFGATSTGFELQIQELGMEVKLWPDELWPAHSCCRMLSKSGWLKENPEAAQALMRAYLRAEEAMQGNMDQVVDLVVKNLDMPKATAESFILSPHMIYDTDPYQNSVIKMWEKMKGFGYIKNEDIKIEDHLDNKNYKAALDVLIQRYPDSQFFKKKLEQYNQNNL